MAYTDDEKTRRRRVNGEHTDNATSDTTFANRASLAIAGDFTAEISLQSKTFGGDDSEGQWIEAGLATGPGDYNLRLLQARPIRYVVQNYVQGTVQVYLDLAEPNVDAFQLD